MKKISLFEARQFYSNKTVNSHTNKELVWGLTDNCRGFVFAWVKLFCENRNTVAIYEKILKKALAQGENLLKKQLVLIAIPRSYTNTKSLEILRLPDTGYNFYLKDSK